MQDPGTKNNLNEVNNIRWKILLTKKVKYMETDDNNNDEYKSLDTDEYPLEKAQPEELPKPTIWPLTLAFGVVFLFWGFVTSLVITITGIVIIAVAVTGWISDMEPKE